MPSWAFTTWQDVSCAACRPHQPALPGTIIWDGRDHRGRAVAGGAYWLRLEDGVSLHTSKITVLR